MMPLLFTIRNAVRVSLVSLSLGVVVASSGCTTGKPEPEVTPIPVSEAAPTADSPVASSPDSIDLMNAENLVGGERLPAATDPAPGGTAPGKTEVATFGAGCFWCVEAVFEQLKGVKDVKSGYTGGDVADPSYRQVCTGTTGHAEATQIEFDPSLISYRELLDVFWKSHDPTTLNRQGHDEGTQYRSAVFYHSEEQKQIAEATLKELDASQVFDAPIVTEITAASVFYPAEIDHQDYYKLNGRAPYCRAVIRPKVDKLKKDFGDKLITIE